MAEVGSMAEYTAMYLPDTFEREYLTDQQRFETKLRMAFARVLNDNQEAN